MAYDTITLDIWQGTRIIILESDREVFSEREEGMVFQIGRCRRVLSSDWLLSQE